MGNDMTLGDYLVKLGRDREELATFLKNPERAMSEAGVPSDQRDAIIQGDVEQVQQLVRDPTPGCDGGIHRALELAHRSRVTPAAERGSLTVVGTGIDVGGQLTPQAQAAFVGADEALYLVGDPVAVRLLEGMNPKARSLHGLYREGKDRLTTYGEMVEAMLGPARAGHDVCAAFYGHPGVFVYPARVAMDRAREDGLRVRMFPGISSLDCLFAGPRARPGSIGVPDLPRDRFRVEPHDTRPDGVSRAPADQRDRTARPCRPGGLVTSPRARRIPAGAVSPGTRGDRL